jgi:hypothetical protein
MLRPWVLRPGEHEILFGAEYREKTTQAG